MARARIHVRAPPAPRRSSSQPHPARDAINAPLRESTAKLSQNESIAKKGVNATAMFSAPAAHLVTWTMARTQIVE